MGLSDDWLQKRAKAMPATKASLHAGCWDEESSNAGNKQLMKRRNVENKTIRSSQFPEIQQRHAQLDTLLFGNGHTACTSDVRSHVRKACILHNVILYDGKHPLLHLLVARWMDALLMTASLACIKSYYRISGGDYLR